MAVSQSPVIPASRRAVAPPEERCPFCDLPIPNERAREIHARIAAKERERTLEVEGRLREQFALEKKKALEDAKQAADAAEKRARSEGRKAAEAAAAEKVAQAESGKKAAEGALKLSIASQEQVLSTRLAEQRVALEAAHTEALDAQKGKTFADMERLEAQVQRLQRQLRQKSDEEQGEGAGIRLFDALKAEFPDDRITRIGSGGQGADLLHEVVRNGRVCGRIVYDSRDHRGWRDSYVTRLRRDQVAANADHAIVSVRALPAGARQLDLRDGVVLANPARVVRIVQILREHILQIDGLRLSNDERSEKTAALYSYITSDRCTRLFQDLEDLTQHMLDLEVKEKRAHDTIWEKRGGLIRSVERAHGTISSEISQIIGTGADGSSL